MLLNLFRDIKGFGVAGKCQIAGVTHVLEAFAFLLKEGGVVKRRSQKPSLVAWCCFTIFDGCFGDSGNCFGISRVVSSSVEEDEIYFVNKLLPRYG